MKKLAYEEFQKRTQEVLKAQRIFGNFSDNISVSFAIYQEVLAEEKMEVFISTSVGGKRPLTAIDEYDRPKCPDCTIDMRLRVEAVDENGKHWNTAWVCVKCQAEFYSENTVGEWMRELKKKDVPE